MGQTKQELGDGRFRVHRALGRGAHSRVLAVEEISTGRRYALKVLDHIDADSVHGLKQKFRALSALSHPNLVRLYELVGGGHGWYLLMEHVRGEVLADAQTARAVLPGVLEALWAMHRAGLVHGHLDLGSVLVRDGRARLTAGQLSEGDPAQDLQQLGVLLGTLELPSDIASFAAFLRTGPTAAEALGRLGCRVPAHLEVRTFVGREHAQTELDDAWARARRGRFVAVTLSGEAGLGKSALLERFLATRTDATVLRGRATSGSRCRSRRWMR